MSTATRRCATSVPLRMILLAAIWIAVIEAVVQAQATGPSAENLAVTDAVKLAAQPAKPVGSAASTQQQVYLRLTTLAARYQPVAGDAESWRSVLLDDEADLYQRMCAAHFLLDANADARHFLEEQLASIDLRERYNAARAVQVYFAAHPTSEWALKTLVAQLASGGLDQSKLLVSLPTMSDRYSAGDIADHVLSPIDDICRTLATAHESRAVRMLLDRLDEDPNCAAACALGKLGNKSAVPLLLRTFEIATDAASDRALAALADLKAIEAIPALGQVLLRRQSSTGLTRREVLTAMLDIGSPAAAASIQALIDSNPPLADKAAARRVLVQLTSADPARDLLLLLTAETDPAAQRDLVHDLAVRLRDGRVVAPLAELARSSRSAVVRREAILGLAEVGTTNAYLALAWLLDERFPTDLAVAHASDFHRDATDFATYFPELIQQTLSRQIGKNLGDNSQAWIRWINGE